MLVRLDLRIDTLDRAVRPNDERRADDAYGLLAHKALLAPRAESLQEPVVRIGQQALGQAVLLAELGVALDRVGTHAENLDAGFPEYRVAVAQTARFFRSARCIVGWICVEDISCLDVTKADFATLVILQGHVRDLRANL